MAPEERAIKAATFSEAVADLSDDVFTAAVNEVIKTRDFIPTVNEFLQVAQPFIDRERTEIEEREREERRRRCANGGWIKEAERVIANGRPYGMITAIDMGNGNDEQR